MRLVDTRIIGAIDPGFRTESGQTFTWGTLVTPEHLCPDLLRYEQIGAADNLRGRVVRAFFWAMRVWPMAKPKGKRSK